MSQNEASHNQKDEQTPSQDSGETTHMAEGESTTDDQAKASVSVDRAEQIVAEWGNRAEAIGTQIGHQLMRFGARAREEAEDIWAEAHELHRNWSGEQSKDEQSTEQR